MAQFQAVNNDSVTSVPGDIVKNSGQAYGVLPAIASTGNLALLGVWQTATTVGGSGVVKDDLVEVNCAVTVAIGDKLYLSAVSAGKATNVAPANPYFVGVVVSARVVSTVQKATINFVHSTVGSDIGVATSSTSGAATVWPPAPSIVTRPTEPMFIDTEDFYRGAGYAEPGGILNFYPSDNVVTGRLGCGQIGVSGAANASTLTIESVDVGAVADWSGSVAYPAALVVQHDDGTCGIYSVTTPSPTTSLDILPRLAGHVTRGLAWNLHDSPNGQHLTEWGYKALARFMCKATRRQGLFSKYVSRTCYNASTTLVGTDWTAAGGLTTGGYVAGSTVLQGLFNDFQNSWVTGGNATQYSGADRSWYQGRTYFKGVGAGTAGQGITKTVTLSGASGNINVLVAVRGQKDGSTLASDVRVTLTCDGSVTFNTTVRGLRQLSIPFDGATSATLSITLATSTPTYFGVTTAIWYKNNNGLTNLDSPILQNGSKITLLCDSWGVYKGNALAKELAALLPYSVVTNASVGGTTAAWALANYDSLVATNQDYVIFDQVINDQGASRGAATWVADVQALCTHALARGQCPVYLRNLFTGSASQSQLLMAYYEALDSLFPQA